MLGLPTWVLRRSIGLPTCVVRRSIGLPTWVVRRSIGAWLTNMGFEEVYWCLAYQHGF